MKWNVAKAKFRFALQIPSVKTDGNCILQFILIAVGFSQRIAYIDCKKGFSHIKIEN
jgi:hypothetical protein